MDISFSVGRIEARLDAQDRQIAELREDVKLLIEASARVKGGYWVLLTLASVAGTLGAFAASVWHWFRA